MKKHSLLLIPCFVLGGQFNLFAAENAAPVAQMQALTTAGSYQEAYELGNANLDEFEGETQFDFYYGLAALETANANEAVFALERAVATSAPGVLRQRARLELARAYFVTNNLSAAENLFNQVLASNPPQNVQQNVQAFLQLIESRRNAQEPSFSWTVASVIGSDDNINSATSNGLIDTPLVGQIELDPDGQQTKDNFSNTTLTMGYVYPFTRDRALNTSLSLAHLDNFDTDQFDIDNLRGNVTYGWGDDVNRFRHGVTLGTVRLDSEGFQDTHGINSSWQRNWGQGWYHNLSASYTRIRYDDVGQSRNSLRDVDQLLLAAGATKVQGALTHSVNVYRADENPESAAQGRHNGREFAGIAYSLLYRLNGQHTPFLRASLQDVEHDSAHPVFFNTVRQDDTQSLTVGWFWQFRRNFQVTGEMAYTDNKSNIPLFDYTRFKYQAGLRLQF